MLVLCFALVVLAPVVAPGHPGGAPGGRNVPELGKPGLGIRTPPEGIVLPPSRATGAIARFAGPPGECPGWRRAVPDVPS